MYIHITDQAVSTSCLFFSSFSIVSLFIPPTESNRGGYYPLYPPECATGWMGGGVGRKGEGVVGRPHFEGASLSSRVFFKAFKYSTKCLGSGFREI